MINVSHCANASYKKGPNPSESQKEMLLEFLGKHLELTSGKCTNSFTFKTARMHWIELTNMLNSIPGAQKELAKGKNLTLQDIRSRTKMKSAKLNRHRPSTEGGQFICDSLTKIEEDVLRIAPKVSVDGNVGIEESVANFGLDEAD
ncbi:hypothetical protein FQA39_LY14969 [Lamprigera yunnana]|nr:hypothetical protein FQA39_LY14969 [Lamprigera yunnana]